MILAGSIANTCNTLPICAQRLRRQTSIGKPTIQYLQPATTNALNLLVLRGICRFTVWRLNTSDVAVIHVLLFGYLRLDVVPTLFLVELTQFIHVRSEVRGGHLADDLWLV